MLGIGKNLEQAMVGLQVEAIECGRACRSYQ
jgi:hypothetical protein